MPSVSVTTSYNRSINDLTILTNYINDISSLEAKYQYMIGEVVMLRLFAIFETAASEIALKLACGATYRNGNNPVVHSPCRSINDAYTKMLSLNRGGRPFRFLKWTKANYIKDGIEHVLDTTDKFYTNIQNHSNIINEMRVVRNHIAHRNKSTAQSFNVELRKIYGANPRLTMGAFLVSTTRHTPSNIQRYAQIMPIILNDISNG